MSKTILLNQSDWHFTKENPGIPTAVMGEAIALPHTWNAVDGVFCFFIVAHTCTDSLVISFYIFHTAF